MRLCFDIDETLLSGYPYETAAPIKGAVELLRQLKKEGHTIILHTARKMNTYSGNLGEVNKSVALLTLKQLETFDIPYDEIYFGKPAADCYIDDKALNAKDFDKMKDGLYELLN